MQGSQRRQDRYGYEISDYLSQHIDIADGTVYPLLRKLKADGLVTTYLQEASGGPPRKYYKLTQLGEVVWRPARRRGQARDLCVRENTSQAASVEFWCSAPKLCAQQTAILLSENPEGFSDSQSSPAGSFPGRAAFFIFI